MTKIYLSLNFIYKVVENGNEKSPLTITREYRRTTQNQWEPTGEEVFEDAGMFINQQGGIDALLSKCLQLKDLTAYVEAHNAAAKEAHQKNHAAAMEREAQLRAEAEEEYKELFSGEVTETNAKTVHALLRYLNTQNWGGWDLPKMTIGYACHQYDCDGKTATTIKLDAPINVGGEMGTMFEYGAPRGHLTKYRRI